MEGADPEDPQAERQARREASRRRTIALRRAAAVVVTLLATAGLWLLLFQDEGEEAEEEGGGPGRGVSEPVAGLVREMSPEERVDQLLMLGFDGTEASAPMVEQLRTRQLGAVLVTRRNWTDPAQGEALVAELRSAGRKEGRFPPLITTLQEGGDYSSLAGLPPGTRQFEIGREADPAFAESSARDTAEALRSAGIDMNLAPVADVATIASPLAARSYSDDPVLATELTAAAMRGCAAGGLACAPSHFPGQGAASQDTDEGPATVSLDTGTLLARDLEPFRAAFRERAPGVVVSLAFFAAYDSVTPAALAPEVSTELLRDELEYDGVAITDDLSAGAIRATQRTKDAAVAAVAAGADLVQISSPPDQEGVADAILEAVKSGRIPEERVSEAAGRVLELKRTLGILSV